MLIAGLAAYRGQTVLGAVEGGGGLSGRVGLQNNFFAHFLTGEFLKC